VHSAYSKYRLSCYGPYTAATEDTSIYGAGHIKYRTPVVQLLNYITEVPDLSSFPNSLRLRSGAFEIHKKPALTRAQRPTPMFLCLVTLTIDRLIPK